MSELMDAALGYAALGWKVLPLVPRGKNPVKTGWQEKATTDPDQIRRWWTENPDYNVGVKTGDGLCVVDVDDKEKNAALGSDMLREWELEHGDISETVCCQTPTGGMHYYFDIGDTRISGCQSDTIFIDLRCDGNLIVVPPSIHPDTDTAYEWDISPEDMAPATATDVDRACIQWVHDNRKGAGKDGKRAKFSAPEIVHEGEGRDETLYKMACSMWSKNIPESAILAALRDFNANNCVPPLPDRIVRQKVRSALRHPPGLSNEVKSEMAEKDAGKPKKANHVLVAERVIGKSRACFLDGAPAVFNGLTYEVGWDAVERVVLGEAPNAKERERKEVLKYLALVMPHEKQAPPKYIGFLNGVLDIETMELLSLTPGLRIPNTIPHYWNPDAHSDLLDTTLRKIACGDPFIEANLCEFIGLSMYRSGKYAFAALLIGKQGENASNGKSTYIDLVRNVLGKGNYSSLSLHALGERFNQDFLAGKLANLGDDISSEFARGAALEVLKKAVAGSEITTDVKNAKGYSFKPYTTMMFSANQFPRMETLDDGLLRRLFPVRFNAHFQVTDPDFDPDIGDKLEQEEVLEAAVVRGVNGLRRVISQRRPTDNDESRALLSNIRTDNSTILQWIEDESVKRDDLIDCTVAYVYGMYERWCHDSGVYRKYAKWQFSKELCNYFRLKVLNTSREGKSVRVLADTRR